MKKIILLLSIFLIIILPVYGLEKIDLKNYEELYKKGQYSIVIKELEQLSNDLTNESEIIRANNIIADSYRMLGKYTNAGQLYESIIEGYFDNYAKYCLLIMRKIAIINGRKTTNKVEISPYKGELGPNPPHIITFQIILGQLLSDYSISERKKYLLNYVSYDENNDWVTQLTKFCANDLSLEDLLSSVSKEDFVIATTYAGLKLELDGDLKKARELYMQVISQKTDKIEKLLAMNRMGLFAFKFFYTTFKEQGNLNKLTNIYAIKTSSAKLEENRLYSTYNLIDGDPKTTWVPIGNKSGIGEWVEFSFDDPMKVDSLKIINGYGKSDIAFNNNNRVKTATLEFSDGSKKTIKLKDTLKSQIIQIGKKTRTIKLTISEVYKGKVYDDTCLSDIDIQFEK